MDAAAPSGCVLADQTAGKAFYDTGARPQTREAKGRDVLLDGLLAFQLLKPGGILVFDDYEWNRPHRHHTPKPGIDAFLQLHDYCTETLHTGYQVAARKAL